MRAVVVAVWVAMVGSLVAARAAEAGPPKVMVLPLDGNADAATRARFSASVQRLARVLDGKVTPGTASFTESATVIGCDPGAASCADDVRATLGVDELVYGTLTAEKGQLVIVVRRTVKGKPPREITATVAAKDPPERAEPALLPLFHGAGEVVPAIETPKEKPMPSEPRPPAPEPAPTEAASASPPAEPDPHDPGDIAPVDQPRTRRGRTLGIAAIAGGGTMVLIGFALWSNAGSLQSQVDELVPHTRTDFDRLVDLEDRATTRAWTGNAVVFLGLALGAYGGWLIHKDSQAQRAVVAPTPVSGGGVGLTLTLVGGL